MTARPFLAVVLGMMLAGCGWLSDDRGLIVDRSDDYLDARERPALLVPEDLSGVAIREVMVVPPIEDRVGSETYADEAPRPNSLYVREEAQSVRIQRLGERSWLLVPQKPAIVWPKIKQFFSDSGVPLAFEAPQEGRLNTRWLDPDSGANRDVVRLALRDGRAAAQVSSGRDRIMLRLEQGIRERTSEIHLRVQNDSVRVPGGTFPESSDIPGIEQEMLTELGGYIAANVSNEAVSFVATNISTQAKARMARGAGGEPVLLLYLDFARGWATVNQSLIDADANVIVADKEAQLFDVIVTESNLNQEEKGWFKSMFDGDDDAVTIRVRIDQRDQDQALGVTIHDEQDQLVENRLGERILIMIREFST
jgi:outer membrane protein assembly factor BamC